MVTKILTKATCFAIERPTYDRDRPLQVEYFITMDSNMAEPMSTSPIRLKGSLKSVDVIANDEIEKWQKNGFDDYWKFNDYIVIHKVLSVVGQTLKVLGKETNREYHLVNGGNMLKGYGARKLKSFETEILFSVYRTGHNGHDFLNINSQQ